MPKYEIIGFAAPLIVPGAIAVFFLVKTAAAGITRDSLPSTAST